MLWCVPALPLVSFLILLLWQSFLPRAAQAVIGVIFIIMSFIVSIVIGVGVSGQPAYHEYLWTWIPPSHIGFVLDPLSFLMIVVITLVGSLVAIYSTRFMGDDPSMGRFFAYLNLFVASMLVLVLADNFLLLFAGWEGVGLCSYLLIGFWYQKPQTSKAANKAFIMTRIGDVFLLLGIIYLSLELGTVNIIEAMSQMIELWPPGTFAASLIASCFLIGAMGKSAQVPLQTWLPDAMLGPTPASALIHAATMVTAGVYLMARTAPLFALAPQVQSAVMIVGAVTLVIGSLYALFQSDLKRVLAYSTISQIGYMFLALGAGFPGAAMFHFMTHAFFKALLFLGAGVIGEALHHEYNMYKMGGLRQKLPLTYYTFLVGSASLAGLPLVTAGFYSKELILGVTYAAAGPLFWAIGCLGAFFTALYVGRMVILVFFGTAKTEVSMQPGWPMTLPLVILAVLSIFSGGFEGRLLAYLGGINHPMVDYVAYIAASAIPLFGLLFAWFIFHKQSPKKARTRESRESFDFDQIYHFLFIKPYVKIASLLQSDGFNAVYLWLSHIIGMFHNLLSRTQTGRIEQYLTVVVASAITVIGYLVLS